MPTRRPHPGRRARRTGWAIVSVSIVGCGDAPSNAIPAATPPPTAAASTAPNDMRGDSTATPSEPAGSDAVMPEGFDRVAARVTDASGDVCDVCVWLAATSEQRSRGLMFVTDLGPADGMAFRYSAPHRGSFWMKNTPLPLSIAFFDEAGAFLDSFDMDPCTADPCVSYPTPADFLIAVEVRQGELDAVAIGPGSTLEMLDVPCDDA